MRPFVTLAFAQSLDGSIALPGQRLELSGPEAMKMTHALRARHDAILVGIGTVLVDNPRLTVRLVSGSDPRPVILDSRLRIPLTANLLQHPKHPLWVVATQIDPDRQTALEALGAKVHYLPPDPRGDVDLHALLDLLGELGIKNLMVEGGARVIQSFLAGRLADRLNLTLCPRLVGGTKAIDRLTQAHSLTNISYRQLGSDMIVEADLK